MADAGAKVLRGLLDVFLLESLERGPKHGYALLREMADAFGTEPNRNRLYPLLGRMVRDGLIVERSDAAAGRTLYDLTDAGRASLGSFRALPPPFKERLSRVWAIAADPASATTAIPPRIAPLEPPAAAATQAPPPAGAPYPCVEARIAIEKDPRTGDLGVQLTGCPMGAYEYCPRCPVYKAVDGLRKITFS